MDALFAQTIPTDFARQISVGFTVAWPSFDQAEIDEASGLVWFPDGGPKPFAVILQTWEDMLGLYVTSLVFPVDAANLWNAISQTGARMGQGFDPDAGAAVINDWLSNPQNYQVLPESVTVATAQGVWHVPWYLAHGY